MQRAHRAVALFGAAGFFVAAISAVACSTFTEGDSSPDDASPESALPDAVDIDGGAASDALFTDPSGATLIDQTTAATPCTGWAATGGTIEVASVPSLPSRCRLCRDTSTSGETTATQRAAPAVAGRSYTIDATLWSPVGTVQASSAFIALDFQSELGASLPPTLTQSGAPSGKGEALTAQAIAPPGATTMVASFGMPSGTTAGACVGVPDFILKLDPLM